MTSINLGRNRRPLWKGALPLLIGAALIVPAAASAAAFSAHLRAPNHTPTASKPWPITVTVTRGDSMLSGSVRYEYLYDGSVVSHQPGHSFSGGVYRDTLDFPREAVGYPLTLRVIVTTRYGTVDLDWAVTTRA